MKSPIFRALPVVYHHRCPSMFVSRDYDQAKLWAMDASARHGVRVALYEDDHLLGTFEPTLTSGVDPTLLGSFARAMGLNVQAN